MYGYKHDVHNQTNVIQTRETHVVVAGSEYTAYGYKHDAHNQNNVIQTWETHMVVAGSGRPANKTHARL